jgi:hypothetical protein
VDPWLGIAFFVLSIPMGMISIMLTPRFVSYLEKRKLIKLNRSKEQDIAAYRSVEAFKNGSRDKYASYIAMSALSVIFAMGGATCILLLALKYDAVFLFVLTFVFFLFSFLFLAIIIGTARRIERFAEYTAEIRKKWGDDAV